MATTPIYGLPYQGLTDAPHGPNLGEELAEAVETELTRIDTDLVKPDIVLAETWYGQAITYVVKSNTTNVRADVDSTNLRVTFTAPASGNVWVELEGMAASSGVTAATGVFGTYWCLKNNADGSLVTNSSIPMITTTNTDALRLRYSTKVTGLSSGTSYTYVWQHFRGAGAGGTTWFYLGNGIGGLMRVRKAV